MDIQDRMDQQAMTLPVPFRQGVCCTYLLLCSDGSLYCGWTNDLEQRIERHNAGTGGKYTHARRPVRLVYAESFATRQEAMRREWQIKQMTAPQKWALIQASQEGTEGKEKGP